MIEPERVHAALYGLLAWLAVAAASGRALAGEPNEDVERKIDAQLARMTLEQKLGQLQQLSGSAATGKLLDGQRDLVRQGRVGSLFQVRGARNTNDVQRTAVEQSPGGIPILFGFDALHGYRTVFPIPLAEASSWDPALAERSARVAAEEASAAGVRWAFAPMVDIARDPRWGRIAEGAGEDPYLGMAMARARVRGLQGDDYGAPGRVVACLKHWVAYGAAEAGREYNAADVSERTLRSIYFPPFRAAVEAGVGTVMTSLNTVDGIPATANPFTIGQVLRHEWKFDGLVVSDYNAVKQLMTHGLAADESEAARLALLAGIDMEEQSRTFATHGARLVADGKVPLARIDEAVRRVLRLKHRLGLFDHPYVDPERESAALASPEHLALAREAAARSLVLLKNEAGLLPLSKELRTIAVLGPLADDRRTPLGHWHSDGKTEDVVTLVAALQAKVAGFAKPVRLAYARGCDVEGDSDDGIAEAVKLARESEVAIVAVGESAEMSGEAASRTSLDLTGRQLDLVKAVHATGTPTVVVLINGRPLTVGWAAGHVPAILEAWFGGTQAGPAIADALFGDVNPGGKLPVTFPRVVGQVPIYYNHLNTGRPAAGRRYTSRYIDAPVTPLFPFGHGLSYTRFRLSNLCLGTRRLPVDGQLDVRVDVENVGGRKGDEVVQLYIRDVAASVPRPVRELKGFARVALEPGARRTVGFTLAPKELGSYDRDLRFVVEPGTFRVFVGTSSVGGLEAEFEVVGK
jgi:beta-glucosidase